MISNSEMTAILDLDLTAIKRKLMHHASGEGWTMQQADAVEREYKRFLYLLTAVPSRQVAPSVDVDKFWHYHILDTMKYAADCEQAFGRFVHHYPYVGMEGRTDDAEVHQTAVDCMRAIYEETFGETYLQQIVTGPAREPGRDSTERGASQQTLAAAAYCGGCTQPPRTAAAYCGGEPPRTAAAYCGGEPPRTAAAYCGGEPPRTAAAYCGGEPPRTVASYKTGSALVYRVLAQAQRPAVKAAA